MFEILGIAQRRVEVTHHRNHRLSLACALRPILNLEERVDHLVNMSAILWEEELASCIVIIFSHRYDVFTKMGQMCNGDKSHTTMLLLITGKAHNFNAVLQRVGTVQHKRVLLILYDSSAYLTLQSN